MGFAPEIADHLTKNKKSRFSTFCPDICGVKNKCCKN